MGKKQKSEDENFALNSTYSTQGFGRVPGAERGAGEGRGGMLLPSRSSRSSEKLAVCQGRQTGQEAPGAELAQVSWSSGEEPDGSQGGAWEGLRGRLAGGRRGEEQGERALCAETVVSGADQRRHVPEEVETREEGP